MFELNSTNRQKGKTAMRQFRLKDSKYSTTDGISPRAVIEYYDDDARGLKLGVVESVSKNGVVLAENAVRHQKSIGVAKIHNVLPQGLVAAQAI